MDFPVTYIERNLVLNRNREVWFLYRLYPVHYEHLSQDARLGLLWRISRLFWNLADSDGQLLIIPRVRSLRERMEEMRRRLPPHLAQGVEGYWQQVLAELENGQAGRGGLEPGRGHTGRGGLEPGPGHTGRGGLELDFVLALRMQPRPDAFARDVGSFVKSIWQEPRRVLEEFLGLRPPSLSEFELKSYMDREEGLFQRLNQVVRASRLDEPQIAWLIRRGFWRGLTEQPGVRPQSRPESLISLDPDGSLRLYPDRAEMARLAEGEMDLSDPRLVAMTQPTAAGPQTGYAAFGYISDLPDELTFPGSEWIYSLQDLPFPVELSLRWSCLGHEEALGAVRRKKLEIEDQESHTRTTGETPPLALLDAQEQVAMLEHDLKQRKFPTVLWSVSCVVQGGSPREVYERVRQLRDHLSAYQVSLDVPAGDQLQAFLEAIPGTPRLVTDYIHRVPPEVAAASMFLSTRAIGDESGPYIGRTGVQQRPVYLDPARAPQLNRSASIAFLGSLGGGKSFAANLMTYLAVVWRGARALVLDPKGERSNWARELPDLAGQVQVITLSPREEDSGKLDPFVMLGEGFTEDDRKETVNLAVSILSFLANVPTGDDRFLALMQAVNEVSRQPQPAMLKVVRRLEELGRESVTIAPMAHYLRALSEMAYANLIFGRGGEAGLSLDARVNVLQLQSVTMPPPEKPREEFSLEELLSVALMHAVTAFATRFTRQERDVFKIVLMDEAWALLSSAQGRSLVSHLLRTGRAMNNAVYLVSQNVADLLDERIKNNIGVKFVFRSGDQDEVRKVLQFLNLEPDEENILTVRGLGTGQALMQDLDGRVGVVTLDPVLPGLARAFDTRPPETGGARGAVPAGRVAAERGGATEREVPSGLEAPSERVAAATEGAER